MTASLATSALVTAALVGTGAPADAIDATWLTAPGSGIYATGSNWSGGSVPDGTASFGASTITNLSILTIQSVGGWTFNADAGNYVVTVDGETSLRFLGAGIVVNSGSVVLDINVSGVRFGNDSTAGPATINVNGGMLSFTQNATAGSATINSDGEISFRNNSTAGNATIVNSGSGIIYFEDMSSGGTARFVNNAEIDVSDRTVPSITMGSIEGSGTIYLGSTNLEVGGNNLSTTYAGVLRDGGSGEGDGGSLTKVGTGTLVLTGASTYTGATLVAGGVLDVEGSLNGTSAVTVQTGTVLMGAGRIGTSTVSIDSGGTLAPGNGSAGTVLTIAGSLAFASGAFYLVQVNPSVAASTTVTGMADLGGATVQAVFAPGSYVAKTYTILSAAGGVSGTFASSIVNTGLPSNVHNSLSYDSNNVYLNLALDFGIAPNLNINQRNVGNGLTNSFNRNGGIPGVYAALSAGGLTLASGELATRVQQTTFEAMGQFVGLLAASGVVGAPDCAAPEPRRKPRPCPAPARWNVWASGFGGAQDSNGHAGLGSHDATSRVFGTAVGADYRLSANTLAGFALAGGGTNFSVTGLGSGRSDLFQAGAYLRHVDGPAYLSTALAYGWQAVTTDRIVTIAGADRLRAGFNANAWSGRVEGGYRFAPPWMNTGITPYAAGQFTTIALPAYAESVLSGSGAFALSYDAKSVTDPRTELGIRTDRVLGLSDGGLTLRGRLAWGHDFNPNRTIAATFRALPDASFVVKGAAQAPDSALLTAAIERTWKTGWSALAAFEGELSNVTRSYTGKGVVRYAW
ncbi:autotransporter domain-containing protein [Bradyrhizobium cosmicum]|uniref:autotransporter domain-containing protein n=1 Tax=Bradyrhizobium cosmicum TaxID=1404864 RepID=UPI0011636FA4|nr:autotransporter domain-containing protein [Bradyrhizobium cosmicum]QDP25792.1 autotransporter domain-containing protein [Bradyrhizobium cosmicum]